MLRRSVFSKAAIALSLAAAAFSGPIGAGGRARPPGKSAAMPLPSHGPNAVSRWNEVAFATIHGGAAMPAVTPEEKRPLWVIDLATLHLAIYDAVNAIDGTYEPFAVVPAAPVAGASAEAAATAAAYGVLQGLFPNRAQLYQATYESILAGLPEGDAKARGLAVGAEVAAGIVALRANDGRAVRLPAYFPGKTPGAFRGVEPEARVLPFIRPFTLIDAAQFHAAGPPPLDSAAYAAAFDEVRELGSRVSVQRTPQQTETARFHAEAPPTYWARNLRQFAMSQPTLAENARLSALIWVSLADSAIGCFESKYRFLFWRPASAIPLAAADGNEATRAEPGWEPLGPVPDHPEYPAAHACLSASLEETLRSHFGTGNLSFAFDSTLSGSAHPYDSLAQMAEETQLARIWGGMHFRPSLVDGAALGRSTSRWVSEHRFRPRG